jgi:hypothetical protein
MLTIIEAELIYRPDGSFIKVPAAAYSARVRQLEAEGYDTSDAQGIADAEFLSLQNEDTAPAVFNPAYDDIYSATAPKWAAHLIATLARLGKP